LYEVGVTARNKDIQSAVIVIPKVSRRLQMADVFHLVEFVVTQKRLYQAFGIEKHVVATQATSELL
jgi:hypothetical protein